MSNDIVDFAKRIVDHASNAIRVCMPAKIESYDYKTQKASIKIDMKESYNDGTVIDYPVVSGVPVIFPSSGGASITMPVKSGDTCLVMFADRDISAWLLGGQGQKPESLRNHALTDAVAILGLKPFSKANTAENNEDLLIRYAGSNIKLKPNGVITIDSANEVNVQTKDVIINCTNSTINSANLVTINSDNLDIVTNSNTNITANDEVNVNARNGVNITTDTIKLTSQTTRLISFSDIKLQCVNFQVEATGKITLTANTKMSVTTPVVEVSNNLEVEGNVTGRNGGVVTTRGINNTLRTIITSGKTIDTHTHRYDRPVGESLPFDTGAMQ